MVSLQEILESVMRPPFSEFYSTYRERRNEEIRHVSKEHRDEVNVDADEEESHVGVATYTGVRPTWPFVELLARVMTELAYTVSQKSRSTGS